MKKDILILVLFFLGFSVFTQAEVLKGRITSKGNSVPGSLIEVLDVKGRGAVADKDGYFLIEEMPAGEHLLKVSCLGFRTVEKKVMVASKKTTVQDFAMKEDLLNLEQVVVTGTRKEIPYYQSPVIVNSISPKLFETSQAVSLSEGLAFSPGLRVETNCQNCGFSQLRMNGLEGAYSQILINSRPIFSALVGVYGLDMLPANMIEKVEVVKGGGSAMYGGSAIGGTVNIITKDPIKDSFQIGLNQSFTDMKKGDRTVSFNGSLVSEDFNQGVSFYGFNRDRKAWDANDDGFTEQTQLKNTTFGFDAFWNTSDRSKLRVNMHNINEFRRGGNNAGLQPHETDITEQLDHKILGGGLSFEQYSEDYKHKVSVYVSAQKAERKSYYGAGGSRANSIEDILARVEDFEFEGKKIKLKELVADLKENSNDETKVKEWIKTNYPTITDDKKIEELVGEIEANKAGDYFTALNSYGNSEDMSAVVGLQYNYDINEKFSLSAGVEDKYNEVNDKMPGYQKAIDQDVNTLGSYVQLEIKPVKRLTLLVGGRYDHLDINGKYEFEGDSFETDKTLDVFVPRVSAMYDINSELKLRASFAQGYRGPQAFDEDLHIETVGGDAVFVKLSDDLKTERSNNFTASLNYTKVKEDFQANIVVEGFYTQINDAITVLDEIGKTKKGTSIKPKGNVEGVTVMGANIEASFAYTEKFIAQVGLTVQKSEYKETQEVWVPGDDYTGTNKAVYTDVILRTPDVYGFFSFTYKPVKELSLVWSGVYTGEMDIPHMLDADTEYTHVETTDAFLENNFKISYDWDINSKNCLEVSVGLLNAFNSFQEKFDTGIDRDAGYVYGPRRPRTLSVGLKYSF